MKSAIKYYAGYRAINPNASAESVISNRDVLYKQRNQGGVKTYLHLVQLQWLGFDYNNRNNLTAIKEYISYIVPKIDIPILSDQFDASLVILKRRFNWDYTDIFYQSYVVTKSDSQPLSASSIQTILSAEVNLGDHLLYQAVNKTWWSQPEVGRKEFWEEVSYFKELNQRVTDICRTVGTTQRSYTIVHSQYHDNITISLQLCSFLTKSKCNLVQGTIRYALGKQTKLGWQCK
ncbi:GAL3ST1 [Bugula neritina]|uniref:GAL3ST1 n=1 Tax=Bugula neritina TaxID=10212 RepID=A0A7J7K366_BUGNE|nr:GAL3ST1 [Bugula neritina]